SAAHRSSRWCASCAFATRFGGPAGPPISGPASLQRSSWASVSTRLGSSWATPAARDGPAKSCTISSSTAIATAAADGPGERRARREPAPSVSGARVARSTVRREKPPRGPGRRGDPPLRFTANEPVRNDVAPLREPTRHREGGAASAARGGAAIQAIGDRHERRARQLLAQQRIGSALRLFVEARRRLVEKDPIGLVK